MVKRKKHDKDKYYNLARQQGYRARSAFKLIQLNKKYDFLSSAKVCIDLCAAPGGWCQVAAKYMPVSSIILGIDLLPIRPIRNVKTFQCDITTQKCRQIIKQELQTWQADVVLCDGAPNVGAEYSKDAFVQNELALIALKLAVDVLGPGGIFVTKVFRSADYNALLWVFKQLFKTVSATKPLSSRNESAEIFVVCEHYLAPNSIDPKLLDSKYVFSQLDTSEKALSIFHPKFGDRKRFRQGYDEDLGMTMTRNKTVTEFLNVDDPIEALGQASAIVWRHNNAEEAMFLNHCATTNEIQHCLKDLKVLGKSDFKKLLKWRAKMIDCRSVAMKEAAGKVDAPLEEEKIEVIKTPEELEKEKEQALREELAQARINQLAKKKKSKKKEAEKIRKLRIRSALGMDQNGIEIVEEDTTFNLRKLGLSSELVDELNSGIAPEEHVMNDIDEQQLMAQQNSSEDEFEGDDDKANEQALDQLYAEYLSRNSGKGTIDPTRSQQKRTKVAKRALAEQAVVEDMSLYDGNDTQYKKLLQVEVSSDESDDDEGDLIVNPKPSAEEASVVAARWFSGNPLFAGIDQQKTSSAPIEVASSDDSDSDNELAYKRDEDGDVLPVMPRTDKSIRKEKRKKAESKKEAKAKKREKNSQDEDSVFANTPFDTVKIPQDVNEDADGIEEQTAEDKERKALLKAGMGRSLKKEDESERFEVVKGGDDRKFDSDNEDYDHIDRARTLALGTMMVASKSNTKEMLDASYNRYAWNDAHDLPEWFQDDEERHYRPQIPISKDLMDQMKQKFLHMASKPIKKVMEARSRKQKLKMKKLQAAKKKASEIASLPDMSSREKMKSIEKTMKKVELKKSNKVYVVSCRGAQRSSSKGKKEKGKVKLVDPRMKSDKRGLDNSEKRAKRRKSRK